MDETEPVWQTINSHPSSGLKYQEDSGGTTARVTQDGHEIVTPSGDVDAIYRQYQARVARASEQ